MKILLLIIVFAATATDIAAQQYDACTNDGGTQVRILNPHGRRFKIKTTVGVNSSTAREADYVEFQTMENIYAVAKDKPPQVLFEKGTPIYGVVTLRKSRHFPFKRGKLELILEPLVNWNGEKLDLIISRHGPVRTADKPKRRNDPCKETEGGNCVAGRGNAEVAPLVPAVAVGGAAALAAIAEEEDTSFIAATAVFTIAKEIGNLLNGTDVGIAKDEIFDLALAPTQACARRMEEPQAAAAKPQKNN